MQHENVSHPDVQLRRLLKVHRVDLEIDNRHDRCIHLAKRRPVGTGYPKHFHSATDHVSYIVTDLMWTNLQHLIARGPVHNDFSKYFGYQILVWTSESMLSLRLANMVCVITNQLNYSVV